MRVRRKRRTTRRRRAGGGGGSLPSLIPPFQYHSSYFSIPVVTLGNFHARRIYARTMPVCVVGGKRTTGEKALYDIIAKRK